MIIQSDIPFQKMAKFFFDNVCELPENLVVKSGSDDVTVGYKDFLCLLKEIYADSDFFDTGEKKASYTAMMNTVRFLYGCFRVGEIYQTEDNWAIRIPKAALVKVYRTGGITQCIHNLQRYGFETRLSHDGKPSSSLGRASYLTLSNQRSPLLIPALKHFIDLVNRTYEGVKAPIYNEVGTFLKGDYATAAGLKPNLRSTLDPLRADILRTTGCFEGEWQRLVEKMNDQAGWSCSGFLHYALSPAWGVSFSQKGQRPSAIFTVCTDRIFIEFTLPLERAEEIILNRHRYAATVRQNIEGFNCVNCPKDCGGEELSLVDGVMLCRGRAEARRIYMVLKDTEEFESIHAMVDLIGGKIV